MAKFTQILLIKKKGKSMAKLTQILLIKKAWDDVGSVHIDFAD